MTPGALDRRRPLIGGMLAVLLALAWQSFVVRYHYGGNWTAWFCTGGNLVQPPALAAEHIYRFAGTNGYDSQFYHYVAHDPLFRRGLARYIDPPRLRYRRILAPALAYLVAGGQTGAIDAALIAVNLMFLFAGVAWSCRYAIESRQHPAWGLLFLLAPAALISLDRLTVDLALTALSVAFALYVKQERSRAIYVVLALAALTRETGLLLTAAYCASLLLERRVSRALLFASSAAPALVWYAFVYSHTTAYRAEGWFTPVPLGAILDRMIHPVPYPFIPAVAWAARVFDECALAGMILAFVLAFWRPWKPSPGPAPVPVALAAILITLSGLNLGPLFWEDIFSFGRVFSPLLVLVALQTFSTRSWVPVLPAALIVPRICLPLAYQFVKAAQALFA